MKQFLDQNFLLENETAKTLYQHYSKEMPIIDFHNHLSAEEIYVNKQFDNISDVWLGGDHYKWRVMRTLGVNEDLVTGQGNSEEKFKSWAKVMPYLIGNPLYQWTHLELQRYFNIQTLLNEQTATEIYEECNRLLSTENFRVRNLISMMNVDVLCTTDDPCDDLKYHQLLATDESFKAQVLPTFRPDKAININLSWFNDWIAKLVRVVGYEIKTLADLFTALEERMDFFVSIGCKASDNGLDELAFTDSTQEEAAAIFEKALAGITLTSEEVEKYKTQVLLFLGEQYHKRNWVMQLHIGALRNANTQMLEQLGPDTGYDAINNSFDVRKLGKFLDGLNVKNSLPKTIIYDLNPSDNHKVVTLMQCFQDGITPGKLQFGSGWWFMDQKDGMRDQIRSLAANGVLAKFVGMLTDSRSFLSFPRHEYFRRLLCQLLGEYVELGEYPNDIEFLGQVVQDISYNNAKEFFGFNIPEKQKIPTLSEALIERSERPIKFVQFGEGNFLRAFVDWMIQELNDSGLYHGDVAVVQPLEFGRVAELVKQDGLYTLIQEGVQNEKFISNSKIIDVLRQFINPYDDYAAYLKLAEVDSIEFIISNTTEAGIVLDESDSIYQTPPKTYPGKLLAFLKHRYETFNGDVSKGLYIVPCELIDNNGDELRKCVRRLAELHDLKADFLKWLDEANTFTNTLVDRIVPGYPVKRVEEFTQKFGYVDQNMVLGEVFHLWVIEDRNGISNVLKGQEAGLNMLFVKDIKPYKIRKVRILNGLHTLMVPVAYLNGINTVGETMSNELMFNYLDQTVVKEMIPATEQYLTKDELYQFASEVYDRFNNPQVHHELMAISLNATSKFKSRLLPTALDYVKINGTFPKRIGFSLASLLVFYRGKRGEESIHLQDDQQFLNFYKSVWSSYDSGTKSIRDVVEAVLGLKSHWEVNLNEIPNLTDEVTRSVEEILTNGIKVALQKISQ